MQPVVVFTVYRRYHELARALEHLRGAFAEFTTRPKVVVVWAQPELGRLWYFQELVQKDWVQQVVPRYKLPLEGEKGGTTYPESNNIRMGLEFVRNHYGPDHYAIIQASDVLPHTGSYGMVDGHMRAGAKAVLFHWANHMVSAEVWHTNFFGVCTDEDYWPPVAAPDEQDVLEWAWGKRLMRAKLTGIVKSNNRKNRFFSHDHLSESLPSFPVFGQKLSGELSLFVKGSLPWLERLRRWFKGK